MIKEPQDINKIVPHGEFLRGFINQRFISSKDLIKILRDRGIFILNQEKDYIVNLMQVLLLSPSEFDKIRESFSAKEDKDKKISRELIWNENIQIFNPEFLKVDTTSFLKDKLPTCELLRPISFVMVNQDPNHIIASFTLKRSDINKAWYEQTNIFDGSIEFKNEQGKGYVRITHTAEETKELAEQILRAVITRYKNEGLMPRDAIPKKIMFSDFNNKERFKFFYCLTTTINSEIFSFKEIKDISIKPDEDDALPEDILWMEKMKKIIISGESLNNTYFMSKPEYHSSLILWSIDALFSYEYRGSKGHISVSFGFPNFTKNISESEFEITIISLQPNDKMNLKQKKELESRLLSEFDNIKADIYVKHQYKDETS